MSMDDSFGKNHSVKGRQIHIQSNYSSKNKTLSLLQLVDWALSDDHSQVDFGE